MSILFWNDSHDDRLAQLGSLPGYQLDQASYGNTQADVNANAQRQQQMELERQKALSAQAPQVGSHFMNNMLGLGLQGNGFSAGRNQLAQGQQAAINNQMSLANSVQGGAFASLAAQRAAEQNIGDINANAYSQNLALQAQDQQAAMAQGMQQAMGQSSAEEQARRQAVGQSMGYLGASAAANQNFNAGLMGLQSQQADLANQQAALSRGVIQDRNVQNTNTIGNLASATGATGATFFGNRKKDDGWW